MRGPASGAALPGICSLVICLCVASQSCSGNHTFPKPHLDPPPPLPEPTQLSSSQFGRPKSPSGHSQSIRSKTLFKPRLDTVAPDTNYHRLTNICSVIKFQSHSKKLNFPTNTFNPKQGFQLKLTVTQLAVNSPNHGSQSSFFRFQIQVLSHFCRKLQTGSFVEAPENQSWVRTLQYPYIVKPHANLSAWWPPEHERNVKKYIETKLQIHKIRREFIF